MAFKSSNNNNYIMTTIEARQHFYYFFLLIMVSLDYIFYMKGWFSSIVKIAICTVFKTFQLLSSI